MRARRPLVGAHMSAAGGLAAAVARAEAAGANALQVFTQSPSRWDAKPLAAEDATAFRDAVRKAGIGQDALAVHAAYLINLASPDAATRGRSTSALASEIRRCNAAGIRYLVLHPGSPGADGAEAGLDRIARGLSSALAATEACDVVVLLETAAGQGASLGRTFDELAEMRRLAGSPPRLAVCLDTCHLHAAGYDLVSAAGWRRMLDELDGALGTALVKVIHANDSKRERGAAVDRHERIGLGHLGEVAFQRLMWEQSFAAVPKILETPKDDAGTWDREGIARLVALAAV